MNELQIMDIERSNERLSQENRKLKLLLEQAKAALRGLLDTDRDGDVDLVDLLELAKKVGKGLAAADAVKDKPRRPKKEKGS
jgi:hypothetical protein